MAAYPIGERIVQHNGRILREVTWFNDMTGETEVSTEPVDAPPEFGGEGDVDYKTPEGGLFAQAGSPWESAGTGYGMGGVPPGSLFQLGGSPGGAASTSYGMPGGNRMADPRQNTYVQGSQGAAPPQGFQSAGTAAGQASVNSNFPGGTVPNADVGRGLLLYNPDNPLTALNNVLQDIGADMSSGNPMVQILQRAAPGLAAAFYMQNALTPGLGADAQTNNPMAFSQYLKNAISSGTTFSGMASMAAQLPTLISAIRTAMNQGTTVDQMNPFLYTMDRILGNNFGEGTTDILASLLGPAMPRSLAQGYQTGLGRALSRAQRSYDFNNPTGDNIWNYLLGPR